MRERCVRNRTQQARLAWEHPTMANNTQEDLNTVIVSAVQARIEAEVATALAGSELMSQFVAAALNQTITVRRGYRDEQTTYLRNAIDGAIQKATTACLAKVLEAEAPSIEKAVTAELKRNLPMISKAAAENMAKAAQQAYGMTVEVTYRNA
jgi:hypothetical protein